VLGIIFIFQRLHILPSFSNWFKPKPVLIDNTPLVITQIKSIALLNTATLYKEMVIDSISVKQVTLPMVFYPFTLTPKPLELRKQIVLIINGKITAGIDLKNMADSNVFVMNDSVRLNLPKPRITDIFINPSATETFYESGEWSNEEVIAVKQIARNRLIVEAGRQQLIQKAATKAKTVIEKFLRLSGFKKINIQFY
jgi:hypothetical protein